MRVFRAATGQSPIEYLLRLRIQKAMALLRNTDLTVTEIALEEGENCEVLQPLIRIVDTSEFKFEGNVDAATSLSLKKGQVVYFVPSDGSKVKVKGKVSYIAPVVDAASGLYEIKAEFGNKDGLVKPGVAGTIHIER